MGLSPTARWWNDQTTRRSQAEITTREDSDSGIRAPHFELLWFDFVGQGHYPARLRTFVFNAERANATTEGQPMSIYVEGTIHDKQQHKQLPV